MLKSEYEEGLHLTESKIYFNLSDVLFMISMVFVLAIPGPSRFKAISIIAFFAYMMFLKCFGRKRIKNNLHLIGSFLFLGFAALSRQWARYPAAVSEQLSNVLWAVLLSVAISTYVIYNNLSVTAIAKRLIPIALLFCCNVLINGAFVDGRFSIGINENIFGRLSCGIACFLLLQCKKDRWKNIFLDLLMLLFVLFTALSGSRTSILMLVLYWIAFFAFEHPTKNGLKTLQRFFVVVAFCVVAYVVVVKIDLLYNAIGNRIESLLLAISDVSEGDGSTVTRLKMMELARDTFLKNPWIGIGMNNFKYATYYATYAHSNYYELAACLGIFGLTAYYFPFVVYLVRSVKAWLKDEADSIVPMAIIVAFFVCDFGSVSYFSAILHIFVGFAIGLISNLCYSNKRQTANDVV